MPKPFKSMPGPTSLPIFGSVFNYSKFGKYSFDRLHLAKLELNKLFGKIYKEKMGPATIVQLFDPVDVAHVFRNEGRHPNRPAFPLTLVAGKRDKITPGLGSLNGEEWYNLRRTVQKTMMHPKAASGYLPVQNAVADDFLNLVKESLGHDGEVPDFYDQMTKYTMESIGTVCFNARLGCLAKNITVDSQAQEIMTSSQRMFDALQSTNFAFPWYALYRTPLYKQFLTEKLTCNRIANNHIQEAMSKLRQCPLASNEENGPNFLSSLLSLDSITMEQVIGLTTDLFVAGIDSTANALSFAVYNLARHPEKQTLLRKELNSILEPGSLVTTETMDKLHYLKACVKESFRINFPVEGGTTRVSEKELVLGDYTIPKGTFIAMNHQTMCLKDEFFDKPKEFIPERWLKDGSASLRPPPAFVMLPFGYGPRMCIGRRFAEQEIYLALIKIVQSFYLEYHHEEIGMLNRVFTMPDRPLKVKMLPITL